MEGRKMPEQLASGSDAGMKIHDPLVFGLDIGTRSVVGTVGYKKNIDSFTVVAQCVRFHETRAMLDGQIHDIQKVAETIAQVRRELERQLGRRLTRVCIAAAGRVLKTVTVRVDQNLGEEDFTDELITPETIHSLEMIAVQKAYEIIRRETREENIDFYCVGYTVVHYYLNDSMITNLEGHKGSRIAAEILATFLPEEVIDGLYAAVNKAGLEVDNLTLEPIAAINVAIPEKFRLLNIALVDVGAGTSDICITKDGTIVAYGMISMAGDAITEVIVQKHLVDFATAEEIKISASMKKKLISYQDIMGITAKTAPVRILEETRDKVSEITKKIAERIRELNGGKSVSAVFIVGGGGKLPTFPELLARHLGLPKERVALRGEEVLGAVTFLTETKKDPLLVTPIGICLNYYEQKNNFVFVQVNGERVKLYDNSHLTIVDAALAIGFPNDGLFPKRGKPLEFRLNGKKRLLRGEEGEPARILLNGRNAGINSAIEANDVIEITPSTVGRPAQLCVGGLPEYRSTIEFVVNGKRIVCPKFVRANQELVSEYYDIKEKDELELLDYYTLRQLLDFMDVTYKEGILVNRMPAGQEEKVYEKFRVDYDFGEGAGAALPGMNGGPEELSGASETGFSGTELSEIELSETESSETELTETGFPEPGAGTESSQAKPGSDAAKAPEEAAEPVSIRVTVNAQPVILSGKSRYIVVDILDFYDFDVKTARGRRVVIKVNGGPAGFSTPLTRGDFVEMYWEG